MMSKKKNGGNGVWPGLSEKERDRRWQRVRSLMHEKGLECLVVFDFQSREQLGKYLTNDVGGGIVVLPLEGEPIHLVRNYFNIAGHMESRLKGESTWMRDVRAPAVSHSVIEVLKEVGLERAAIGIVGLYSEQPGSWEGQVPFKTWSNIVSALPHASFHEVSVDYCSVMLVKSEEELRLVRRAAQIAEMACKAMLDTALPGVGENEIFAAAVYQLVLHGANTSTDVYTSPIEVHSGTDNPTWGPPKWMVRGQKPRILQKGDVITSEIFSTYGGLEAQAQMAIGIEPLDAINKKCAQIARKTYERGVKILQPGKRLVADVSAELESVVKKAGAYHLTPLIHTVNPIIWVGKVATDAFNNLPGLREYKQLHLEPAHRASGDLVIEPNMVFELETNASIGKHRVNLGGTVLVTENGVEELNYLATEMRIVS